MRKILLDFSIPDTKEKTQEYIAEQMGFSDSYGKNLDALYDELVSISQPTAVGIFTPIADMMDLDIDLMVYFDQISEVFNDAEDSNSSLAVIYGDLVANPGYEDQFEDIFSDDYLMGRTNDAEYEDEDDEDEELESMFDNLPGEHDVLMLDLSK